ncbi:MAG TPA: hypothetical protein VNO75_04760, partial [Gemmatimonadaceae bacterium]|nr:hypothetical protein [Gemmatimonadaceae bacterium]
VRVVADKAEVAEASLAAAVDKAVVVVVDKDLVAAAARAVEWAAAADRVEEWEGAAAASPVVVEVRAADASTFAN